MYDELYDLKYVESPEMGDGVSFLITPAGRAAARRIHDEYRPEAARRAVLSYLRDARNDASLDGLEDSSFGEDHTGRLRHDDIEDAVDDLERLGLIEGPKRLANGSLPHARITSKGRAALRGPAPIGATTSALVNHNYSSATTHVIGDNNQVAAGTHGPVTQTLSVDNSATVTAGYEDIAQLIRELLDHRLPLLALSETDQHDLIAEAEVVLGEVTKHEPDRQLIRRALNALRGVLSPLVTGISQAATAESAELARHTFDQITSSGFF
ncbi:hypothetical protein EEB19_22535 [Gordonia sp. OPL2]|nr:hypothetical protein EEB19_22535 [Gordonia sp. OPL2]